MDAGAFRRHAVYAAVYFRAISPLLPLFAAHYAVIFLAENYYATRTGYADAAAAFSTPLLTVTATLRYATTLTITLRRFSLISIFFTATFSAAFS